MSNSDLNAFYGPNAGYVLELYDRYLADPDAVDTETRAYFASNPPTMNGTAPGAGTSSSVGTALDVKRVVAAAALTQAIREFGHLAVQLDPLGSPPIGAPELDPAWHGTSADELRGVPAAAIASSVAEGTANAAEAIDRMRAIYSGTIGYDFDHVQIAAERAWLRDAVECGRFAQELDAATKRKVLERLTAVESFERFLHQTYLGQKRFSIEGTDTLVPMLDEIIHAAAQDGTREIVIGMAHRGRLNVLTHLLGKPYAAILAAFEGGARRAGTATSDTTDDGITGDVKYHLGATLARNEATGNVVEAPIVLAPNPSHLEFVNPVVEGMTRASQDDRSQPGPPRRDPLASQAILLHGDAAFPGQGIVAETLNLSVLPGYATGGTIHIIVNNQVGFTTDIGDARSTLFAGDLAKGFEIPVVHVNADDPEACLIAARLAIAYRDEFGKDFLIDLVGYRRWGHNEGDEPTFTQPMMYATIAKHPTVRALWAERLAQTDVVPAEEAAALQASSLDELAAIRRSVTEGRESIPEEPSQRAERREVETAVAEEQLRAYHEAIHALPEGFAPSQKLARQWERRRTILDQPDDTGKVDWAHAESLAFAAILAGGIPIRLTGQDAERGTFSQRHVVLHDGTSGASHTPLQV
nr:2-oxoglutarate dehydrogenase E1 component [Chloroflexia bacterium]